MPRMTKIRIAGVRYDRFRKRHENTILNMSVDDIPSHTLLTLMNQGGKGVLMQLISQVILPATRWGKNDGNKIEHMFYDQKRNLYPYTIHIALEWLLDGAVPRHLTTGICMTAFKQSAGEDEEESAGLDYFTYTMEYSAGAPLSIDTLPLYDHQKKEALEYSAFKTFVKEHERRIAPYTKSQSRRSSSDYYTALKSYGIFRSEWEIMKSINKVEGGVGDYFSQAKDNKSLFDRMLIPAIVANLKSVADSEELSLVDAFRSNLNVTRFLPVLLKREAAMISLMEGIVPVIETMDIGGRYDELIRKNRKKGHDLHAAIEAHMEKIEQSAMRWEVDKKKNAEEEKHLKYKLDNMEYIRCLQEIHKLEGELENTQTVIQTSTEDLQKKEDALRVVNRDLMICEWNQVSTDLNMEKKNRDLWLSQMDMTMVMKLDVSKREIMRLDTLFHQYANKRELDFKADSNKRKDSREAMTQALDTLREDMIPHQGVIHNFEQIKQQLKEEEETLYDLFSPFDLIIPDDLLSEIQDERAQQEKHIENMKLNKVKVQEDKRNLEFESKALKLRLTGEDEKLRDLTKQYENRFMEEKRIVEACCKLLSHDPHGKVYSKDWVERTKLELEDLLKSKLAKRQKMLEKLWRQKIDQNLNQGTFWIPNEDLPVLKKQIKAQGVAVMLGSEYLKEVQAAEREPLMNRYPDLPFGLILEREENLEQVLESISVKDILHSAVPVFVRQKMTSEGMSLEKVDEVRHYLKNVGDQLALDEEAFISWKGALKRNGHELSDVIDVIGTAVKRTEKHIRELVDLGNESPASELKENLRGHSLIMESLKGDAARLQEDIFILEDRITDYDLKLADVEQVLEQVLFKHAKLENYVSRYDACQEFERKASIANEKLKRLAKEQDLKKEMIHNLTKEQEQHELDHNNWKHRVIDCSEKIDRWLDVADREWATVQDDIEVEFDFNVFENLLSNHRLLMQSIEDDQKPLMDMEKRIETLAEALQAVEQSLYEMDAQWQLQKDSIQDEATLRNGKILLVDQVGKLKNICNKYISEWKILEVRVEEKQKDAARREKGIERDHVPYKAQWQDDVIVDSEIALVKRQQTEVEEFLIKAEQALMDLRSDRDDMQSHKVQLSKYNLDSRKGTLDKRRMESLKRGVADEVTEWIRTYEDHHKKREDQVTSGKQNIDHLKKILDQAETDSMLHERLKTLLVDMEVENFITNRETFESIKNHFQKEVQGLKKDKERAEDIQQRWSVRAARYVMQIVHSLQDMVQQMVYANEQSYDFPLVRLKGQDKLPSSEDELIHLMKMLFTESIEKLLKYENVDEIPESVFRQMMSDAKLFSYGLRGHYPVLEVYKMTEANEFKYYQPREEFYSSWESINKGGQEDPEGSGGQTLSVNTFVMMMLMSHQKRYVRSEHSWTFLMMDNPFGKASAKHILDPVFEIADSLNFQLLCFAPPELIKTEISERFPVFWALEISEKTDERGQVTGHVKHGGRRWKQKVTQ